MAGSINYSGDQYEIIREIEKEGNFSKEKTRLLIIMSTYNFARTKEDLVGILCEYSGLSDKKRLKAAIEECIRDNYLTEVSVMGSSYCIQNEECLNNFLSSIPKDTRKKILLCRNQYNLSNRVKVEGLLSGGGKKGDINAEFIMLLQDAQSEILLPMFNTSANDRIIKILKDRALAGVKIKILLADYDKVVKKHRPGKQSTVNEWKDPLSQIDNVEIRIYTRLDDAEIYSSAIIDRRICRICVFDVRKEKSSNGTLITCTQEQGEKINLIDMMIIRFFEIWGRSYPVDKNRFIFMCVQYRIWEFVAAIFFCIFFIKSDNSLIKEICIFAGTALGANFFTLMWKDMVNWFKIAIRKFIGI